MTTIRQRQGDYGFLAWITVTGQVLGLIAYYIAVVKGGMPPPEANMWGVWLFLLLSIVIMAVTGSLLVSKKLSSNDKSSLPGMGAFAAVATSVTLATLAVAIKPPFGTPTVQGFAFIFLLVFAFLGVWIATGLTSQSAKATKTKPLPWLVVWLFFASCTINIAWYPYLSWGLWGGLIGTQAISGWVMLFVTTKVKDDESSTKKSK